MFNVVTLPAYWASYLINGDASGISEKERALCDNQAAGLNVIDVARDDSGEAQEARFTWSYDLYSGDSNTTGGEVLDYICQPTD